MLVRRIFPALDGRIAQSTCQETNPAHSHPLSGIFWPSPWPDLCVLSFASSS